MIFKTEDELKRDLSVYGPHSVTLLCGTEPALVLAYRRRILDALTKDGGEIEHFDGKKLDVSSFCENAVLVPLFGPARIISVEDFDPNALSERDADALAELLDEYPPESAVIFTIADGVFDEPKKNECSLDGKKSANAKKLIAAADKNGVAAALDKRKGASLYKALRSRCQKGGCELSSADAQYMVERCGDDMGLLLSECDKLCFYAGNGHTITREMINEVCAPSPDGDLYSIARLMLSGDADKTLGEIADLLAQRMPASLIIANLGIAFADLSRATAARMSALTPSQMAKDLSYRFEWKAKNAFRDSEKCDPRAISRVCIALCEAETAIKTVSVDERVLLETTVIRCLSILREGR